MWADFTVLGAYLPFCDGMFVDKQCHELLQEHPIVDRVRNTERVFSLRCVDEFTAWLQRLERDAGAGHIERVERVYGTEWLVPFRSILELERERG
jgi:hypothetical protein